MAGNDRQKLRASNRVQRAAKWLRKTPQDGGKYREGTFMECQVLCWEPVIYSYLYPNNHHRNYYQSYLADLETEADRDMI